MRVCPTETQAMIATVAKARNPSLFMTNNTPSSLFLSGISTLAPADNGASTHPIAFEHAAASPNDEDRLAVSVT